jgi:membrane-bound lytic murein transglycosylase B
MGIPQFISSSYRHYAVDFDNDGVRDLFHSPADIIGSVANYLQAHRWILDGPVAVLAEVQGNRATRLLRRDLEPYLPVGEMQAYGVSVAEPISPKEKAGLLRLETDQGYEYWVGFQNFYTITRYNRSPLYAMAVYQLAQEILVRTISGE